MNYILPNISPSLLEVPNISGRSTPLHWAAINGHLSTAQALVLHPRGPGPLLINPRNAAGHSPLTEAELAGAEDVAKWLVEVMVIDQDAEETETSEASPEAVKMPTIGAEGNATT